MHAFVEYYSSNYLFVRGDGIIIYLSSSTLHQTKIEGAGSIMVLNGVKKRRARADSSSASSSGSSASDSSSASSDGATPSKNTKQSGKKTTPSPTAKKTPNKAITAESLRLDPPTFSLKNYNTNNQYNAVDSDRYELWSIRLPVNITAQELNGRQLSIPVSSKACLSGEAIPAAASNNTKESTKPISFVNKKGETYTLRWGQTKDNESFRLLLRHRERNGQDDDANNTTNYMMPVNIPFQRHINAASFLEETAETKLAPGIDTAPRPNLTTGDTTFQMRKAYETVPQKTGLKRRWMPSGSVGAAAQEEHASSQKQRTRSLSASSLLLEKAASNHSSSKAKNANPQKRKRSGSGIGMTNDPSSNVAAKRQRENNSPLKKPPPPPPSAAALSSQPLPTTVVSQESQAERKARKEKEKTEKKLAKKLKKEKKEAKKTKKAE